MRLQFSKAALNDLVRLRKFIAEHNPTAAQQVSRRLKGAINNLVDSPRIGRPIEGHNKDIRELIFGRYVVRYEVCEDSLYVLRIWHGKEDR